MYEKGDVDISWLAPSDDLEELEAKGTLLHHEVEGGTCPIAYLPHSCDEWIIGGPDHVRAMIADLEAALAAMER